MLEMRPNCETCDADLPADEAGAFICSFECTFCSPCTEGPHAGICPTCGGKLEKRPVRAGPALERFPARTKRVLKTK